MTPKQSNQNPLKTYALFDSFPEGCQVIGPTFEYLYVNSAVAKQGKSTKKQLLGHTMMERYPGIEKTPVFAAIKKCLKTKKPYTMINEFTFPNGDTGYFELKLRIVNDGVLILSEDVTDRERRLDEHKKMFEMMIDREIKMAELKKQIKKL